MSDTIAESISANNLSVKTMHSNRILVNGQEVSSWLQTKISAIELDPIFKEWLKLSGHLSSFDDNLISSYAKKSELGNLALSNLEDLNLDSYLKTQEFSYISSKFALSDQISSSTQLSEEFKKYQLSGNYVDKGTFNSSGKDTSTISVVVDSECISAHLKSESILSSHFDRSISSYVESLANQKIKSTLNLYFKEVENDDNLCIEDIAGMLCSLWKGTSQI